jgi:hypothetical protein
MLQSNFRGFLTRRDVEFLKTKLETIGYFMMRFFGRIFNIEVQKDLN